MPLRGTWCDLPRAFDLNAIDKLGANPSFRRLVYYLIRLPRAFGGKSVLLDIKLDAVRIAIHKKSHFLVHRHRVVAFDQVRFVPVAAQQPRQLVGNTRPGQVGLAIL